MVAHPIRLVRDATLLVCLAVALASCGGRGHAPVLDGPRSLPPGATYTVRRGDTLYSIAWHYRTTVRTLARINGLRSPYTIYPGQRIRLTWSARSGTVAKPARPAPAKPAPKPPSGWRWPTKGKVVAGFGATNKGMDFEVPTGSAVVAAAAGEVVYAGNGLGGYQHLVIIQHNSHYLSAYSMNVRGRVSEGARVKAGTTLADISTQGRRAQRLHFEIRRDGKAIDPKGVIRR